jgi:uncharacterized membrane protein YagU involved in acid resistance
MQNDVKAMIAGMSAGAVATVTMSGVMLAAKQVGLVGELPPERITEESLEATGLEPESEPALDAATVIAHFCYGIGAGALFGLLSRRLRLPLGTGSQGIAYGLLVWLVSYMGWVPALGFMPPATRDQPGRPLTMIIAHVVFGWTLGAIVGRTR